MNLKLISLGVVLFVTPAWAVQDGLKRTPKRPSVAVAETPVTHQEVNATLTKLEKILTSLPSMHGFKVIKRVSKPGPASRDYIIIEMSKLFDRVRPNFKFTPAKLAYDPKQLLTKPAAKPALQKLISWGFVAKVGPLATGPQNTIGLRQFGDAMGLFITRVSDLTHTPDPKFSPGMMDRVGG